MEKFFNRPDFGKLLIRVVLGLIFAWYGVKMIGIGNSDIVVFEPGFSLLRLSLSTDAWTLLVAIIYLVAGILFMAGSFFKTCSAVLTVVELLLMREAILARPESADLMLLHLVLAAICFGFLFITPGRYSANP